MTRKVREVSFNHARHGLIVIEPKVTAEESANQAGKATANAAAGSKRTHADYMSDVTGGRHTLHIGLAKSEVYDCEYTHVVKRNVSLIGIVNTHKTLFQDSFPPFQAGNPSSHPLAASQEVPLIPAKTCHFCIRYKDSGEEKLHCLEVAILFSLIARPFSSQQSQVQEEGPWTSKKKTIRGLLHHCHRVHDEVLIFNRFDLLDHIHRHHKDYYHAWLNCSLGHHHARYSEPGAQPIIREHRVANDTVSNRECFMTRM